jgi:LL-diaminopimelate aminotransferase
MESRLPPSGGNLFQEIKAICALAESQGQVLYRLSIGEPTIPPFYSVIAATIQALLSQDPRVHGYQDNGCFIPDYAKRFVQALFPGSDFGNDVAYLPNCGNKSLLKMIILSCNLQPGDLFATVTEPGYPTPAIQGDFLKVEHYALPTNPENEFLFQVEDIRPGTKLLMLNYPHNPSGQIATREWWHRLCHYCEINKIRIFNDNPYQLLSHFLASTALCEIAILYPQLGWLEAFSSSKIVNTTGWRIGSMIGSKMFIDNVATIKGNCDSGFAGPLASGILSALENDRESIVALQKTYFHRIETLVNILTSCRMQLTVLPKAGFFTLWLVPKRAFNQDIVDAKHFNSLMIEKTGIVGVPFHPYIRYAVTIDIDSIADIIRKAFEEAYVYYY